ncbi:MAG: PHP domain-containing protein [Candidatus Heimdallarchaeota archaeon]|nr:PHP domain-containing protein [Candidatus Heimdallarchaeota archaeon]
MRVDLHLHSEYSWDSKVPIESYIKKAEKLGFGAISITDHNDTQSHGLIKKLQESTSVIIVPGQEINTLDGHLLIYGWLPTIDRDLSMIDTVIEARKQGGESKIYCIAAHPFDSFRGGKGKRVFEADIDGIEILNASAILGLFNTRAKNNCQEMDFIKMGNSDSHRISEFGIAWTEIAESRNTDEVLQNLIGGDASGGRIGIRRKSSRFFRRKFGKMTD